MAEPASPHEGLLGVQRQQPVLPRYLVGALGLMASLASLWLLHEVGRFIAPVFLALNLIITAYPLHAWLVRKGTPRWLAALVMMLAVLVALLLAVAGLVWAVGVMINELPNYSDQYWRLYREVLAWLGSRGFDDATLNNLLRQVDPNAVVNAVTSVLSTTSGLLGIVAIIVASLAFMAMDAPGISDRMQIAVRSHPRITRALRSFAHGVRRYWLVTTVFGLMVALLDGIVLVALGVPMAMVWALFSFLTNYIPNVGFVIGLVPPALVALLAVDWQTALIVVLVYTVANFVVQSLIQPRFTGESVGVTPTVSFVSLLLWGWVLGAVGTLIALPMTLLVKALLVDADPKSRWFNALIASNPNAAADTVAE